MIAGMSTTTADVLFGAPEPEVDAGYLSSVCRRLANALDAADPASLAEWALHGLKSFPSVPALPDLDFDLALPQWDSL